MYQRKKGYIYLAYCLSPASKRYKIGFTKNINSRLKQLNNSQAPYPIEIIKYVLVINAASSEKFLQEKYSKYVAHNEWFDFEDDQLASILLDMDELEKISTSCKARDSSLKWFLFLSWCRDNNIFEWPVYRMPLGHFTFLFKIEKNVFNPVYFKHFDYYYISELKETLIKNAYEEVRKAVIDDDFTLRFKFELRKFIIVFLTNDFDSATKVTKIITNSKQPTITPFPENIKYCLLICYGKEKFSLHTQINSI